MGAWSDAVICPQCRHRDDRGLHLRTLDAELRCACGARFDRRHGVAQLVAGPPLGLDDDDGTRLHLSIYLDAHHGDRTTPAAAGPTFGLAPLLAKVTARATTPVARAVELGCSVGRITAALAAGAAETIGLDLHLGALRAARQLLDGAPLTYPRRHLGGRAHAATIAAAAPAANVHLLCADALDPPLAPGCADRVVAFGMLDSVASPRGLLAVLDGLCAPGGELLLATPYAWTPGLVDDDPLLGGDDPAAGLRAILEGGERLRGRYVIEDEAELPWVLRRDARSATTYQCHYLRARRE